MHFYIIIIIFKLHNLSLIMNHPDVLFYVSRTTVYTQYALELYGRTDSLSSQATQMYLIINALEDGTILSLLS